jgi:hypothetical protein
MLRSACQRLPDIVRRRRKAAVSHTLGGGSVAGERAGRERECRTRARGLLSASLPRTLVLLGPLSLLPCGPPL